MFKASWKVALYCRSARSRILAGLFAATIGNMAGADLRADGHPGSNFLSRFWRCGKRRHCASWFCLRLEVSWMPFLLSDRTSPDGLLVWWVSSVRLCVTLLVELTSSRNIS